MIRRLSSEAIFKPCMNYRHMLSKVLHRNHLTTKHIDYFKKKHYKRIIMVFMHQNLVSKIMSFPFTVNVYDKEYRMGGIGNVASYP